MKKAFITMCAVLIASVSMAAGHVDSVRYLTTKFGQNWFVSADGNIDWWKGSAQYPTGNYDAVQWSKPDFGGSINFGKWINHKIGLRLSYDINGGKAWNNNTGPNCGHHWMFPENCVSSEWHLNEFVYHNLHIDGMFSPIDFFQGYYNPNRIYTPVIYAGMGGACVSENIFVLMSEHRDYEMSFDAGLINNFRLNDYFDLHLDFKYSLQRWSIDSWSNEENGWLYSDGTQADYAINSNGIVHYLDNPATGEHPIHYAHNRADQNFSIGLGLTWYIGGRIYELPYNYEKEMKEMSERIKNLEDELAAIPAPVAVEQAPCDTVVIYQDNIEAISYPFSIFFNLDSYQLMSKRDLVNLREIANVAKANNYKLRLRGSCDSATATPEYNQKLSENRCRKIMMELLDMGFPEENIILEPVGGVKELDPTEFDRRVLIDLIKYHE